MTSPFRQDINWLRAWAVVAVVMFHFHVPPFRGGFVGVDVFFVISGYLMAQIIISQIQGERYSIFRFLTQRFRRIYPALVVMVWLCTAAEWWLTLSDRYLAHIRQGLSALGFLSNLAFKANSGYFGAEAQTKPLLHTWSLSIEWQFYLGLACAMGAVFRLAGKTRCLQLVLPITSVALVSSWGWCLIEHQVGHAEWIYFDAVSRAWEMLAGACAALLPLTRLYRHFHGHARATLALATVGWTAVLVSPFLAWDEARWPGLGTTFPVLGAMLVLMHRVQGSGPCHPVLRWFCPAVSWIGLRSYSIYLYHWPVYVLALGWLGLRGYRLDFTATLALVAVSCMLGAASYTWVETPFRHLAFWSTRRMYGAGVLAAVTYLCVGAWVFAHQGFPSRMPDYMAAALKARQTNTPRDECFRNDRSEKQASDRFCSFGAQMPQTFPTLMLWGDSTANQYLIPVTAGANLQGVTGLIATQSGCRPRSSAGRYLPTETTCQAFNREVWAYLAEQSTLNTVIFAGNYGDGAEAIDVIRQLRSLGKRVVYVLPGMNLGMDVTQHWIEEQARQGHAIEELSVPSTDEVRRGEHRRLIEQYTHASLDPSVQIVDPLRIQCPPAQPPVCYLVRDNQANFRDTLHINNLTADKYTPLFSDALQTVMAVR